MIQDERVGDDQIESAGDTLAQRSARLAHAVADNLAAAKGDLVAIGGEVLFDFYDERGIAQADAIAGGGTVQVRIHAPRNRETHSAPFTNPR